MSKKSPAIGIDLGTTYCCVAYMNSNQIVEIIENTDGQRVTPSYVAFTDDGEIIGKIAKEGMFPNPENVVYDAKRLIGQKFDNIFLHPEKKYNWPFKVTSDADATPLIEITCDGETKKHKPQEISAILLKYMKMIAEERLDTEVKNAVITVPAYFNYHQRTATKEAAELAGLNVLKIINEPTAAALAYVHKNQIGEGTKNILVFDLGGGTFDVSVVTVQGKSVTVRATAGNTALGGRDFENNFSEYISDKIEQQYKTELKSNTVAMRRISKRSENLKIELSSDVRTHLDLDSLVASEHVYFVVTRSDFNQINSKLFQTCIDIVNNCLKDAKMSKREIDNIVLVGGSTRIPKIQELLSNFFEGKKLTKAINPDEAVAYGAAVQAAMFNKNDKTEVHYEVNDVTPLSLGTSISGNLMSIIIPRNSKIPISRTKGYCTAINNQTTTTIEIYEGERSLVQHNTLIGTSTVKLPPKPPGYHYDITFHVNTNGILEVGTKTNNGDYTSWRITYEKPNKHASDDILKDAEINKAKDNKIRNVIKKWNRLGDYCTKMKALCDYDRKGITKQEKINIRNICDQAIIWLYNNKIKNGSLQEKVAILDKCKEVEKVCEPIANSYGYYVIHMPLREFHKLLTNSVFFGGSRAAVDGVVSTSQPVRRRFNSL